MSETKQIETIVTDVNEYIDKVERRIIEAKKKERKYYMEFFVKFASPEMAENFRRYFKNKGYNSALRQCFQCKHWDVSIEWA